MPRCQFELDLNINRYRCKACGHTYSPQHGQHLIRDCKEPHRSPGIITKAKNYTKAVATHIITGAKKRDQEEIDRIFVICESNECGHYNGSGCNICGCCVGKTRKALFNKIAMASQNCPIGKWEKEAKDEL